MAGADHPENDMKLNMKKANHDNNFEKLKHVVVSTLAAAAVIKRKFWLMRKAIKSDKLLLWLIEKQSQDLKSLYESRKLISWWPVTTLPSHLAHAASAGNSVCPSNHESFSSVTNRKKFMPSP